MRKHGIPPLAPKGIPSIEARIDMIADLAEKTNEAKQIRGKRKRQQTLRSIARQYEGIGMRERAAQIRHMAS